MILHALIYDKHLVSVGLYSPPSANVQVLYDLIHILLKYDTSEIFLFGDFNMVLSHDLDRLHSTARPYADLQQWASTFTLTDASTFTLHVRTIAVTQSCRALSRIHLAFASSTAVQWMREPQHLSRGVSDHASLCITLSLSNPLGLRLWHLCRYWALDTKNREPLLSIFCNYWVLNEESANNKGLWDALKSWVMGEYIS